MKPILLFIMTVMVAACSSGSSSSSSAVSLLYVQEAASGTLTPGTGTQSTLSLNTNSKTLFFSDHPQRTSGSETTATFVVNWTANGFAANAPNAALEVADSGGNIISQAVSLSAPSFDANTGVLTYTVTPLSTYPNFYQNINNDGTIPATFNTASLFIDDGTAATTTLYQPVTFTVSNVQAGQTVEIDLSPVPNGSNVVFCSGQDFDLASIVDLMATGSGVVPLSALQMQPKQIVMQTTYSGGGGGGAISYTFTTSLCGTAGINYFYLRNNSDANILVTAAVGEGTNPMTVNLSNSAFAW